MQHDNWIPACGGTEQPFTVRGETFLYMWNTTTGEHAYYSVTRDLFLEYYEYIECTGG